MTENVVLFPKIKKDSPPQSIEEMKENIQVLREEHANQIVESLVPLLYNYLMDSGCDVMGDNLVKESVLLLEAIRSIIFKNNGLEHPMHEMLDSLFVIDSSGENGINFTYLKPTPETENVEEILVEK